MSDIALPTGRIISTADVTLDTASQRFKYGSFDVTDYMVFEQMSQFDGFDNQKFLDNRYREHAQAVSGVDPGGPLPTGMAYVVTETVAGAANDLAAVAKATPSYITKVLTLVVVGAAIYLGLEVVKLFPKKR